MKLLSFDFTSEETVARTQQKCDHLTTLLSGLEDRHVAYWADRWIHETVSMRKRLDDNRRRYYFLRGLGVIAGVVVPALVGVNISGGAGTVLQVLTLCFSIVAGGAVALAEALQVNQRYRLNRSIFPYLYREGLTFATLTDAYSQFSCHQEAVMKFVSATEHWVTQYETGYSEDILTPQEPSDEK